MVYLFSKKERKVARTYNPVVYLGFEPPTLTFHIDIIKAYCTVISNFEGKIEKKMVCLIKYPPKSRRLEGGI